MTTKSRCKDRVPCNSGKDVCHFAHTFNVNLDISAGKRKETHSMGICLIGAVAKPFREHHREFEHFQVPEGKGKGPCIGYKSMFKRRRMPGLCQ